jgi:hypothetical protein
MVTPRVEAGENTSTSSETNPLVREGAPYEKSANIGRYFLWKRKKNWSLVPDGDLIPGKTDRLTIGRKITLTLTLSRVRRSENTAALRVVGDDKKGTHSQMRH